MSHKLYGGLYNFRVNKIMIVANFVGVPLEHHVVKDFAYIKSPEYLAKHPLGKVPLLETKEGDIFESSAITRFLARSNPAAKLYGDNDFQAAQIDQWIDLATTEIDPQLIPLVYSIYGWRHTTEELRNKAHQEISKILKVLDEHLKKTGFFVGTHYTLADLSVFASLMDVFRFLLSETVRQGLPNLTKWFSTLAANEHVKNAVGTIHLTKSEWPAHPDFVTKGTEETKKPKEQPKKEEKKKEEKKPAEKKPAAEEEEEAEKKPAKNPLDLLPPSTFNLYDYKTLFVNAPNKADAFKVLWDTFDPQGYSIWIMHYQKAEGENTKLFLTSNMAGGIQQRLDDLRKYAFGVHGVYGEEGAFEIKGCLLWRGTEHPQPVKDLPNYEWHTFRRLDTTNEADRKLVENYWTHLEEGAVVDGLKVAEVKYFK